jgi:prepilin-type N-terminal cleavage/methylation domain-containing protein
MQGTASRRSRPACALPHSTARAAFTLLELLIAIAIIGILASLILTVAGGANIRAKNVQVGVDIKDLEKGIAAFKQKFGIEPPSHITLYETAAGWNGDPRSMGIIRQIWPQFDFTYSAYQPANPSGPIMDINANGVGGDSISLTGSECLVFFLGGVPALSTPATPASSVPGSPPMGFSQNPADPFNRAGTNRDRFTEFDASRLFLLKPPSVTTAHTMNSYMDTLPGQTQPYLYFSAYGGQGYDLTNELPAGPTGSQLQDIYRTGPNGKSSSSPSPPWNPNSFQIISPGFDQTYGVGGEYESGDSKGLLVQTRSTERDNITNFSSVPMAP